MTAEKLAYYKEEIASEREFLLLGEANARDELKDRHGESTGMLRLAYRQLGILEWIVAGDIESFRANLARCAALQIELFQRFNQGGGIDPSYVSMLAYRGLIDALAGADFEVANALAMTMGGRPEIERENDTEFTLAFGYALKDLVVADSDLAAKRLEIVLSSEPKSLSREDQGMKYSDFRGYVSVIRAIVARDERELNSGLEAIVNGHRRQSASGIFSETIDKELCIGAIGLANLATHRGLAVRFYDPLLPQKLTIL
jgi:hypothetical protein